MAHHKDTKDMGAIWEKPFVRHNEFRQAGTEQLEFQYDHGVTVYIKFGSGGETKEEWAGAFFKDFVACVKAKYPVYLDNKQLDPTRSAPIALLFPSGYSRLDERKGKIKVGFEHYWSAIRTIDPLVLRITGRHDRPLCRTLVETVL